MKNLMNEISLPNIEIMSEEEKQSKLVQNNGESDLTSEFLKSACTSSPTPTEKVKVKVQVKVEIEIDKTGNIEVIDDIDHGEETVHSIHTMDVYNYKLVLHLSSDSEDNLDKLIAAVPGKSIVSI